MVARYCCSACAVAEQISSDTPPSDEFPQCASEGETCRCTGTIYFGEPGSLDWSEVESDGTGVACTTANFGDTAIDSSTSDAKCYCGGSTFVGCYDDVEVRPLESFSVYNSNQLSSSDVSDCITSCRNAGMPYAVLQYARLCFCSYGFPARAKIEESKCSSRCGETDIVIYDCGGTFANSLFAVSSDPYSCSNGIQDGGEAGVDCGGKCDGVCNLVSSGSFEDIASTTTSRAVSTTTVEAASDWSGSGYIVHSGSSSTPGNGQAAPDGQYYFAVQGKDSLKQYINGTVAPGYMLQVRFSASYSGTSSASNPPTLQLHTGSPVPVDEVDLSEAFVQFTSDFDIYKDSFTLQFSCSADTTAYCLLDAVELSVTRTCDDASTQALAAYSSDTLSSCSLAVREIQGAGLTCAADTTDVFHVDALAVPDNFCCSECAATEGNSGMLMPDALYPLCAYENHQCYCDGTTYFGKAGWGDWSTELTTIAAGVACDTSVFGDPAEQLTDRACYCDGRVVYNPSASDYVGCFSTAAVTDFDVYIGSFSNMSLSVCMTMCVRRGQTLFAVSEGNQCYCSGGYPKTAEATSASNCDLPCAGVGSEICGGELHLSVYQFGPEQGTCSDGKQDGSEEGIDCGGDCPDKCNMLKDGSFEGLTDLTTKVLMNDPGAWTGEAYIYYHNQGSINKKAIDGDYFAALYGRRPFNQTVTGVCNGDILDFSYWAAKVNVAGESSPTLEVLSNDVLWEEEVSDLTSAWRQFGIRLIVDRADACCGESCSLTLGFQQASDGYGAIIDDVRLTVESECEDLAQAEQELGSSCGDFVTEVLRKGNTCKDPLGATKSSLAGAGNVTAWDVCCSACWSTATSHISEAPNNMYALCAPEDSICYCEGTIFYGIDNTYAWSYVESSDASRGVMCSTANFDDPNPSSRSPRNCYCSAHTVTAAPTTAKKTTTTTTTTAKVPTTTHHVRTTTRHSRTTTTANGQPSGAATTPAPVDDSAGVAVAVVLSLVAVGAAVAVGIYAMRRRKHVPAGKYGIGGMGGHNSLLSSSSMEMEMPTVTDRSHVNSSPAASPFVQPEYSSGDSPGQQRPTTSKGKSAPATKKRDRKKSGRRSKARTTNHDSHDPLL